LVYGAGLENQ